MNKLIITLIASMTALSALAETTKGLQVETFSLSTESISQWEELIKKYNSAEQIPHEVLLDSTGYLENYLWIKSVRDKGYTILDAGNPKNSGYSLYYQMEQMIIKEGL